MASFSVSTLEDCKRNLTNLVDSDHGRELELAVDAFSLRVHLKSLEETVGLLDSLDNYLKTRESGASGLLRKIPDRANKSINISFSINLGDAVEDALDILKVLMHGTNGATVYIESIYLVGKIAKTEIQVLDEDLSLKFCGKDCTYSASSTLFSLRGRPVRMYGHCRQKGKMTISLHQNETLTIRKFVEAEDQTNSDITALVETVACYSRECKVDGCVNL